MLRTTTVALVHQQLQAVDKALLEAAQARAREPFPRSDVRVLAHAVTSLRDLVALLVEEAGA